MQHLNLTIILPVHNEAKGITRVLSDIYTVFQKESFTHEIICVENGSKDDSLNVLLRLKKKYPTLRVVQSGKGWGNAVQKGIKEAKGEYLCYMVSDGQISPKYISLVYHTIRKEKNADLVKVSRKTRENIKRFMNSKIYNFLAFLLFQIPSSDINGTPKILKTTLAQSMKFYSNNIAIDMELLLLLQEQHKRFIEIPIESYKRETGESSTKIKTVLEMLLYMKNFFMRFRLKKLLHFSQRV